MINRYCKECGGITPWNKAENTENSKYICEGCGAIKEKKELKK